MRSIRYTLIVATLILTSACSTVSPWEKGNLARPEMALAFDPLEAKLMEHVYFAKEGSSSGSAVSGGGCGCN